MRYYYFSYLNNHLSLMGNSVWHSAGDFPLHLVHSELAKREKTTAVVISFQEITHEQYQDFGNYCKSVQYGEKLPTDTKSVLKLINNEDKV